MAESLSVLAAARDAADAPFLIYEGGTMTFAETARRVAALGWQVEARGVTRGQEPPIAFVTGNDVPCALLLLALFALEVPALLLHPRWTMAERERVLARGAGTRREPRYVDVASFDFDASDGATTLDGKATPFVGTETSHDAGEPASDAVTETSRDAERRGHDAEQDDAASHDVARHDAEPRGDGAERIAVIVFTSGSSGEPRGVMLSERALVSAAAASAKRLQWCEGDVWELSLPACHIGGLSIVTRCLLGRKAIALEGSHREDSRQTGTLATLCSWVPTQLHRVLEAKVPCPPKLRAVLVGGAAAAPSLVRRGLDAGYPLLLTYGSSEMGSQIATQLPGTNSTAHCGPPLDGVEVELRQGRLRLRGQMLASGYYPDEPLPTDERGFFETSDLAELDEGGNLRILGRADDVIVTGGENVSPLEVEAALSEHPDVRAACVFGREDPEFGQRVCAAVVTQSGGAPDDLPAWLSMRLAGYKRPRSFWVLTVLPLLANGKVDRRAVKERCVPGPR